MATSWRHADCRLAPMVGSGSLSHLIELARSRSPATRPSHICLRASTLALLMTSIVASACAIHYFDPASRTEHVFALGHIALRLPDSVDQKHVIGFAMSSVGAAGGTTPCGAAITLGVSRETCILVLDPTRPSSLYWPRADLLNLRVGEEPLAPDYSEEP